MKWTPWERMALQLLIQDKMAKVLAEPKPAEITDEEHKWFIGQWTDLESKLYNLADDGDDDRQRKLDAALKRIKVLEEREMVLAGTAVYAVLSYDTGTGHIVDGIYTSLEKAQRSIGLDKISSVAVKYRVQ
jgi:hypothetical protein